MDLEDTFATPQVRCVHDNLTIEPPRSEQRRIQNVGPVRRRDEDDPVVRLEAIHLDEQLVECLLTFVVPAAKSRASMATHRVDLVDKDDAWCMGLPLLEQIANTRGTDTDEHLDEIRSRHREERPARLAGDGAREQRLTSSRRTHEQRALRQAPTQLREPLRIAQELDDLLKLLLRLIGTGDIGEGHLGRIAREELRLRLTK